MLRADAGQAQVLGGDPWRDAVALHRRLAYVPGDVNLWPNLSGGEVIDLLGRLRGGLDPKRRDELLERFDAGAVLERADYLEAAEGAAAFVLDELSDAEGRLLRTWKDGRGRLNGYLEDHAFLLEALLTLYEATFEPRWFTAARRTADAMIARFADEEHGGFFETSSDHEQLLTRRKDLEDHPIPSGNASAAYGLLRLAALTGELEYEQRAVGVLRLLHELAVRHPHAFSHTLQALDFHLSPTREVALAGPRSAELERVVRGDFRPHVVLAGTANGSAEGSTVPLMEGREPVDGRTAAYVCERFACQRPVTEPAELAALLS